MAAGFQFYYTGSLTGSLGQLTSGMVFNNTFCYNAGWCPTSCVHYLSSSLSLRRRLLRRVLYASLLTLGIP